MMHFLLYYGTKKDGSPYYLSSPLTSETGGAVLRGPSCQPSAWSVVALRGPRRPQADGALQLAAVLT